MCFLIFGKYRCETENYQCISVPKNAGHVRHRGARPGKVDFFFIRLSEATVNGISMVEKAEPSFFGTPAAGSAAFGVQQPLDGPNKTWSHASFDKTMVGSRNITTWMMELPLMFQQKGLPLLDSNGCIQVGGASLLWADIAKRTPSYFDVVGEGIGGRNWGKAGLQKLLTLVPKDSSTINKVRAIAKDVDHLAVPLLPAKMFCTFF